MRGDIFYSLHSVQKISILKGGIDGEFSKISGNDIFDFMVISILFRILCGLQVNKYFF